MTSEVRNSRMQELVDLYEAEHQHPVNRALHFWVGMPLVGFSLLLFARRDWRGAIPLGAGFAAMFYGHYRYEKKAPLVMKNPLGAVAGGAYVIDRLFLRPLRRGKS